MKMRKCTAILLSGCLCLGFLLSGVSTVQGQKKQAPPTAIEQITGHSGKVPERQLRFTLPNGVKLEDSLSEDEAVAIALWNNATLHADLSVLGLARADLLDAGLLRNPLLNLVLPIGPYRQFESALTFPLEVFWQRRKRVEAATIEVNRVAQSLEQNALNLMRDVRLAYTDWTFAVERVRLADEAVDWRQQTTKLINVRLRVGDIGEIEATAARLDQSLAMEQATRLRRDIVIARDRLRQLLGMSEEPMEITLPQKSLIVLASLNSPAPVPQPKSFDEVLQAALTARPELRAAEIAIETAAKRAKWEHSRWTTLAGLLNLKQGEGVGFAPRPGIVAELPIFNRNQGGIARADAEVERASWQYLATRQRIANEVKDAFNQYWQARETLTHGKATSCRPPKRTCNYPKPLSKMAINRICSCWTRYAAEPKFKREMWNYKPNCAAPPCNLIAASGGNSMANHNSHVVANSFAGSAEQINLLLRTRAC